MEYNEAQEKAVNTTEGQVMLVSCPGSGKTSTMLRRIKHMADTGIDTSTILMVTFTDAAANEMKSRYEHSYGECDVTFCTIHSLCFKLITQYSGNSSYKIMSSEEQRALLKDAMSDIKLPAYIDRNNILDDIGSFKNSGKNIRDFSPTFLSYNDFVKIYNSYEEEKSAHEYMDFDDMLIRCRSILSTDRGFLRQCRERYRYIICDEYQDTNPVQKDILYLLAGTDGNLCIVGDDDQSIYGFRGADPDVMLRFPVDYPDCVRIDMDINYRSYSEITDAGKYLIEQNRNRFPKDTKSARGEGGQIEYISCDTREQEIATVVDSIKRLHNEEGIPYNEMSVLARTNQQLDDIASIFEKNNVLFSSNENIPGVYEHFIYNDLISYLKLINGDASRTDLVRVMNRPYRGFREADYKQMTTFSPEVFIANSAKKSKDGSENARRFCELLESLKGRSLYDQVNGIIHVMEYEKYLDTLSGKLEQNEDIFLDKLDYFAEDCKKFKDYKKWMRAAASFETKHREENAKKHDDGVILSTMHKAKGLEWKVVFLVDCCQGMVPFSKAKTDKEIEEERRLFYVAVTRAKDRLYVLSYSRKQSEALKSKIVYPSVFIDEMQGLKRKAEEDKKAADERREADRKKMAGDFMEGEPKDFRVGDVVHHKDLGRGTVSAKTLFFVTITFDLSGSKIFKIK